MHILQSALHSCHENEDLLLDALGYRGTGEMCLETTLRSIPVNHREQGHRNG
jgi:hypothetical protein